MAAPIDAHWRGINPARPGQNRSAQILEVDIDDEGAMELAKRSRGTPRLANRILRRARDFAQVKAKGKINIEVAKFSLEKLGIDSIGLDNMDRKILSVIIEKFSGLEAKF